MTKIITQVLKDHKHSFKVKKHEKHFTVHFIAKIQKFQFFQIIQTHQIHTKLKSNARPGQLADSSIVLESQHKKMNLDVTFPCTALVSIGGATEKVHFPQYTNRRVTSFWAIEQQRRARHSARLLRQVKQIAQASQISEKKSGP